MAKKYRDTHVAEKREHAQQLMANPEYAEKEHSRRRAIHHQKRSMVIQHYGGRCVCCGEGDHRFLTVDHINNDGAAHRKSDPSSKNLYYFLFKNNFPDGFQLLCWNCNHAKEIYGVCPHQEKVT